MTVWILLPAFNEERSIPILFPQIRELFAGRAEDWRIVTVDDGSTDATPAVLARMAADYPLDVVTHRINRGLGETERDGFEFIAERAADEDVIVRLDCDVTHEPVYIARLVDKVGEGFDVVNTSRFQEGGGQVGLDAYRRFVSRAANIFMDVLFHIPGVRDYSCGFRAYRARVVKDCIRVFGNGFIQLKGLGFTSTLEMIVKLKLLGCRFAEVPFVLRYDKKASPSKMVGSVTTLGYLVMAVLYHYPFGGWRRFYRDLAKAYRSSPSKAADRYRPTSLKRSAACQIGG